MLECYARMLWCTSNYRRLQAKSGTLVFEPGMSQSGSSWLMCCATLPFGCPAGTVPAAGADGPLAGRPNRRLLRTSEHLAGLAGAAENQRNGAGEGFDVMAQVLSHFLSRGVWARLSRCAHALSSRELLGAGAPSLFE
jgi:hypothetical protein